MHCAESVQRSPLLCGRALTGLTSAQPLPNLRCRSDLVTDFTVLHYNMQVLLLGAIRRRDRGSLRGDVLTRGDGVRRRDGRRRPRLRRQRGGGGGGRRGAGRGRGQRRGRGDLDLSIHSNNVMHSNNCDQVCSNNLKCMFRTGTCMLNSNWPFNDPFKQGVSLDDVMRPSVFIRVEYTYPKSKPRLS